MTTYKPDTSLIHSYMCHLIVNECIHRIGVWKQQPDMFYTGYILHIG